MQVYLYNTCTINTTLLWPRQVCKWSCWALENRLYRVQCGVFVTKFGHRLLLSLSAQPDNVWRRWKKIIARTLCFMHQKTFRPNYIFNNEKGCFFLSFCAKNYTSIFFFFETFLTSTSPAFWDSKLCKTTKMAPVKFCEDLLYFQHFMQIFLSLLPNQWLSPPQLVLQSILVISKSKGPAETLRDIRTSTYQMCRIEETTKRTTKFNKWTCSLTPLIRNICWK